MVDWSSDARGGLDDRVRLVLAGEEVAIAEQYECHIGFLTVPSTFALRLGHGGTVSQLLKRFRPNTPFQLFIGGALQMTGATDTIAVHEGEGSIVTIEGRDRLALLHDSYIEEEKSYTDATYFDFVARNLTEIKADFTLFQDAAAARKIQTGVRVQKPPSETSAKTKIATDAGTAGSVVRIVRSKMGERRYEFVKRHLDRAGLFLRNAPDGTFILSEPNGDQKPLYRILRRRMGSARNTVSVRLGEYRNSSAPPRYTGCVVFARHGGRKHKRGILTSDASIDDEMWNDPTGKDGKVGFGIKNRFHVTRDANVYSMEQASAFAQRKLAEGRRACWRLQYIATGHTTPALVGGGRAVWSPDTVVHVTDDELDLDDDFWIESVTHRRTPQTETVINLMRKMDLLFGNFDE